MKITGLLLSIVMLLTFVVGCSDNPTIDLEYYDDESSSSPFSDYLSSLLSSSSEESSSYIESSLEENTSSESELSSKITESSETATSSEDLPSSENTSSSELTSSIPDIAIIDESNWNLAVVSPSKLLPEGYEPERVQIKSHYASEGTSFDARAIDMLNQMCDAALEDGIWLWVASAWRSEARQANSFKNELNRVLAENPDMSAEDAEALAATEVAKPRTSEHHLGLAVDFNILDESFTETKQCAWLQEHAHEYGFIMRYPKEKEAITGVVYEPWHYRYVGVEHAAAIKNAGLCLEEYLGSASN